MVGTPSSQEPPAQASHEWVPRHLGTRQVLVHTGLARNTSSQERREVGLPQE